jgi:type IV secretion system protein VirB6
MMDMCSAAPAGTGFIGSVGAFIDCQAQTLGSGAWIALAAPGSTLSAVLTGFLTLSVALIGYRLLLGDSLTVRSGTLALVKIGAVLALATSWPAYRTLVYDLVVDGPSQLVSEIGPAAHIPGSDGTLVERLDLADRSLAQLAALGPGASSADAQVPPPPFSGFDEFALGGSRILFLLTAVASIAAVRIVTGIMLALGPFFIAFFLFEATRSLFEGWVRVLAGAALAAFGVSIALGLELALLGPWLNALVARRMAGEGLPAIPSELLVLVSLFTIITIVALRASARAARTFRLPLPAKAATRAAASEARREADPRAPVGTGAGATVAGPSRAATVANAVAAMTRRETESGFEGRRAAPGRSRPSIADRRRETPVPFVPAGRSFTHSARRRGSARADRRDAAR